MNVKLGLSYDDVLIIPQFSDIRSRDEVDLSSWLIPEKIKLKTPFILAPMIPVAGPKMIYALIKMGAIGTTHRFCSIPEQVKVYQDLIDLFQKQDGFEEELAWETIRNYHIPAALGIKDLMERTNSLLPYTDTFIIDVANGHNILAWEAVESLRHKYGQNINIIAGNVCTSEGASQLAYSGADTIRFGIGGSAVCSTRIVTGVGYPNLSALEQVNEQQKTAMQKFGIIADGGIRGSGTAAKALVFANIVMGGAMVAGTNECPIITEYFGMSSAKAMQIQGKENRAAEGVELQIKPRGSVIPIMEKFVQGLKSAFSYVGARNIEEFQKSVEFVRQTNIGLNYESKPHGKDWL